MVKATFEYEDNDGLLKVITHFDWTIYIACEKRSSETFRLGGTGVNDVVAYEGLVLVLSEPVRFRAFRTPEDHFEDVGVLSPEEWTEADRHCYVTEYYSLNMEGKRPGWFISRKPIRDANHLFINLDVLDGGGNLVKRYRVSPFTGEHCVMDGTSG